MCGMATGSISGVMLQKKQTENWGKGTGVYIYSSGDPGAGGCRSQVDLTGEESLWISGRWRMAGLESSHEMHGPGGNEKWLGTEAECAR